MASLEEETDRLGEGSPFQGRLAQSRNRTANLPEAFLGQSLRLGQHLNGLLRVSLAYCASGFQLHIDYGQVMPQAVVNFPGQPIAFFGGSQFLNLRCILAQLLIGSAQLNGQSLCLMVCLALVENDACEESNENQPGQVGQPPLKDC
jgi:hypothetical protein